jgi:hypothetical protein
MNPLMTTVRTVALASETVTEVLRVAAGEEMPLRIRPSQRAVEVVEESMGDQSLRRIFSK